MRITILIALLITCAGCKHGYPVTNQAPFASYIGHDLALKRTAVLVTGPWFEIGSPDLVDATFTNSLDFRAAVRRGDSRIMATLSSGTNVRLKKVDFAWDAEAGCGLFLAWGTTALPEASAPVNFRYIWGVGDTIDRAPWDGSDVPTKRYVNFEPR